MTALGFHGKLEVLECWNQNSRIRQDRMNARSCIGLGDFKLRKDACVVAAVCNGLTVCAGFSMVGVQERRIAKEWT